MSLQRPQAPDPTTELPSGDASPASGGFDLVLHTLARGVIRPLFAA